MLRKLTKTPRRAGSKVKERYHRAFDAVNPVDRPRSKRDAGEHPVRLVVTVVVATAALAVAAVLPFALEFVVAGVLVWLGAQAHLSRRSDDSDGRGMSRIRRGGDGE